MVTAKQACIGFVILFLLALLIAVATFYWQHVTGMSVLHMLADNPLGPGGIGQGC